VGDLKLPNPLHRFERHEERSGFVCSPPEIVRLTGNPAMSLRPNDFCPGCGHFVSDEDVYAVFPKQQRLGDLELNLVVALMPILEVDR
jgi:hypothetical protein